MAVTLAEIEAQALQLPPRERGKLAQRLLESLDAQAEDSPEALAQAWDEEITRRVADMEAGRTEWIPAEEVFKEIDKIIDTARKRCA